MGGSISAEVGRPRSRADHAVFSIGQGLREDASVEQAEGVPLSAGFGLEVPENPALGVALERLELRFEILTRVGTEGVVPLIDEVVSPAAADPRAAGVRTVISSADAITVERRSAIRHCRCPFPDHHPLVGALVRGCHVTHLLSMLPWGPLNHGVVKDLVFVMVDKHYLGMVSKRVRGQEYRLAGIPFCALLSEGVRKLFQ